MNLDEALAVVLYLQRIWLDVMPGDAEWLVYEKAQSVIAKHAKAVIDRERPRPQHPLHMSGGPAG